jgi:UDP-3-O-[3-hydroxymyristoyl] glucosamine N-acyltransferase
VAGHLSIGDDATISAQAGVNSSVKAGESVLGAPASPAAVARRRLAAIQKLPEMKARMRTLEREIADLKEALNELRAAQSA